MAQVKLARAKSGIGSPGGPSIRAELVLVTPESLSKDPKNFLEPGQSQVRRVVIVKCLDEHCKVKIPRDYLSLRLRLGIDDLPGSPSAWFLDEFFGRKSFAFFDLRNQGRIVEEVTDTLLRFSSLIPVLVVVVATDGFGRGVEASLKSKVGAT